MTLLKLFNSCRYFKTVSLQRWLHLNMYVWQRNPTFANSDWAKNFAGWDVNGCSSLCIALVYTSCGIGQKDGRTEPWISVGWSENDLRTFCCLRNASCSILQQPVMMSIGSPVTTEPGDHSFWTLLSSRNVEKLKKFKKHIINLTSDTLDWQANFLEVLWQSHNKWI